MSAVFIRKAYKKAADKQIVNTPTGVVQVLNINKFAFETFNRFAYNCEINRLFIANTLLDLPEFYISYKTIKRVNLQAFHCRFIKVIFEERIEIDLVDDFICFKKSKKNTY